MPVSGFWGAVGGAARAGEQVADSRIAQINRSAFAQERDAANVRLQELANTLQLQRDKKLHEQSQERAKLAFKIGQDAADAQVNRATNLDNVAKYNAASDAGTKSLMGGLGLEAARLANDQKKAEIEKERAQAGYYKTKALGSGGDAKEISVADTKTVLDVFAKAAGINPNALDTNSPEEQAKVAEANRMFNAYIDYRKQGHNNTDSMSFALQKPAQNNEPAPAPVEEKGFFDKTVDTLKSAGKAVVDFVTGEDGAPKEKPKSFNSIDDASRNYGSFGNIPIGTIVKTNDGRQVYKTGNDLWDDVPAGAKPAQKPTAQKPKGLMTPPAPATKPAAKSEPQNAPVRISSSGNPQDYDNMKAALERLPQEQFDQILSKRDEMTAPDRMIVNAADYQRRVRALRQDTDKKLKSFDAPSSQATPGAQPTPAQQAKTEAMTNLNNKAEQIKSTRFNPAPEVTDATYDENVKKLDELSEKFNQAFPPEKPAPAQPAKKHTRMDQEKLKVIYDEMRIGSRLNTQLLNTNSQEERARLNDELRGVISRIMDKTGMSFDEANSLVNKDMDMQKESERKAFAAESDAIKPIERPVALDETALPAAKLPEQKPVPAPAQPNAAPAKEKAQLPPQASAPPAAKPAPRKEPPAEIKESNIALDPQGKIDEIWQGLFSNVQEMARPGGDKKKLQQEQNRLIEEMINVSVSGADETLRAREEADIRSKLNKRLAEEQAFNQDEDSKAQSDSDKLIVESAERMLDRYEQLLQQGSEMSGLKDDIMMMQKNIIEHGGTPKQRKLIPSKFK